MTSLPSSRSMAVTVSIFACLTSFSMVSVRAEEAVSAPSLLKLSSDVAAHGRAAKDPVSLIVAASIRANVATRRVDRAPVQTGTDGEAIPGEEPSVRALLDEAVAMSGKDPTIAALAGDVTSSATKGRTDGVAASVATIKGAGVDWYRKVSFEGTRYAEAYVELFGDGRLTISIWDEKGNLVCKDVNPSTYTYCGWNPATTGRYDVKIENLGARPVRYKIATN